jgi:hypothetical protein
MAAIFTSGTEYPAWTGAATTRPKDCNRGIVSVLPGAGKEVFMRWRASSREMRER